MFILIRIFCKFYSDRASNPLQVNPRFRLKIFFLSARPHPWICQADTMACSDSIPTQSSVKRKRQPFPSREQSQEEDLDESTDQKKPKLSKTWENLDLILNLQSKELHLQRKVDLAFDFASSEACTSDWWPQPISFSRALSYVCDWTQSLMTSSDQSRKSAADSLNPCLDCRCWAVLKFCLEKSSSGASPNLLRAVTHVLKQVRLLLDVDSSSLDGVESRRLFENVLQCLSSLLVSNSRAFYNTGVDLWISCAVDVIDLVSRVSSRKERGSSAAKVLLDLSILLLEQFANFLRFHPKPKNIFRVFVERLLEPLFELLVLLQLRIKGSDCDQLSSMLRLVEEVLSNGLFHPAHIGGFFSLRISSVRQEGESRRANESYHRYLFWELERILDEKKLSALGGFACLLRLFASKAKGQDGSSAPFRGTQALKKGNEVSGDAQETRMPLFEVFVLFMKPLLHEFKHSAVKEFSRMTGASEHSLIEVHCTLRSLNETLESFIQEKIYVRTDDTPEGKHYSFLKEIYNTVYSISVKMHSFWLSALQMGDGVKKMLPLIAREIVVAVGYFLDFEYRVFGDDLVIIWLMLLSYMANNISTMGAKPCSLLTKVLLSLGCKLLKVYGELRQVNIPLFALCKATRFLIKPSESRMEEYKVFSSSFLSSQLCLQAAKALLCSQEFRLTIADAVKSVPEGQTGGCIQQLNVDLADALEWMRQNSLPIDRENLEEDNKADISIPDVHYQAELLGRILSEIYATVLDSLTITSTNSILIWNSIKNLLKTLRPSLSCFVQTKSNNVNDFVFSVTKRRLSNTGNVEHRKSSHIEVQSMCWVFLFFFRVHVSSKNLYRELISLMPPDSSRKASESFGNLFSTSCSLDWVGRPEHMDEGYFSCIAKPSISLPDAIKILSEDFLSSSFAAYAPLVYILLVMILQRLSDLSRLIRAFEFFHEKDARLIQMQLHGDANVQKSIKKWKWLIAGSRKEAVKLTNFMIGHLSLLDSKGPYGQFDFTDETSPANEGEWDFGVCSLNEKSLCVAVWWLFCQSTNVWCAHSTKKHLKIFLSYLFLYALPCLSNHRYMKVQGSSFCAVTLHRISVDFLQDTISYEQLMLDKSVSSRFRHILKKSLSSILLHTPASDMDFGSLPNWVELLNILEGGTVIHSNEMLAPRNASSSSGSDVVLPSMRYSEQCKMQSLSSFSMALKTCESLLNLFCKMPRLCGSVKSFSQHAAYILNIERLLLFNLLNHHDEFFMCDPYELLSLFASCRRAMKYLVMSHAEKSGVRAPLSISAVFDCSSSVLWLLKSVYKVAGLPNTFFGERDSKQVQGLMCSLIDHTSHVFLKISEAKANAALLFLAKNKFSKEHFSHNQPIKNDKLPDSGSSPRYSESCNEWKYVELIAEVLKEHAEKLLVTLNGSVHSIKLDASSNIPEWNNASSVISYFQEFLLGLISASSSMLEEKVLVNRKISSLMRYCISKLSSHIAVFEDVINLCLNMLIVDGSRVAKNVLHVKHDPAVLDYVEGTIGLYAPIDTAKSSCSTAEHNMENHAMVGMETKSFESASGSEHGNERSGMASFRKQSSAASRKKFAISFFNLVNKIDLRKLRNSWGSFLENLLKDGSLQVAFMLRQLYITSATILRLKCTSMFDEHLKCRPHNGQTFLSSTVIVFGTSYSVLQEFSEMIGQPCWFMFAWLDGVITYFDVLGSLFSFVDPEISKDLYDHIIDLHLKAIGKCISLKGKAATLSFHDIESGTKILQVQNETITNGFLSVEHEKYSIDAFRDKLRISFKKYIRVPSMLYLRMAIQAIERKLVGVRQDCTAIYELSTGNINGGRVSSAAAASIECLELILESFSGHQQFLKESMVGLVGAIINVVLHLQNPSVFYVEKLCSDKSKVDPDAGAVILMCIEVLTKVSGRRLFQMDPCHVSHCFHLPMMLFEGFHKLRSSHANWNSSIFFSNDKILSSVDRQLHGVDHQFSVELYTSCCRLLCSTLKHQKSGAEQGIPLLQESVSTLLGCLEVVDSDTEKREYFSWELGDAIRCANFLRRIYEELRHQKDAFGKYASFFLSNYISTFSGHGRSKAGIRREIDEALRPGVYSLIDICNHADLQQLHTVLAEGPCRSTLATLLHDYQQYFQYEGKI